MKIDENIVISPAEFAAATKKWDAAVASIDWSRCANDPQGVEHRKCLDQLRNLFTEADAVALYAGTNWITSDEAARQLEESLDSCDESEKGAIEDLIAIFRHNDVESSREHAVAVSSSE